jgi:S1-C subfamily serine protease
MNKGLLGLVLAGGVCLLSAGRVRAEMSADQLMTLARKVRPGVMLMIVFDDSGRGIGSGTGFVVSRDGKLVTNRHVANAGPRVVAKAPSGRQYRVLGALAEDSDQDLVLLQIENRDMSALTLGSSDDIRVGTPIVMIGNPLEMESTVQEGTVSGFRQFLGTRRWIEITAPFATRRKDMNQQMIHGQGLQVVTDVAPGSSGSPVLDSSGNVVGVITAVERTKQITVMAIPVEAVKELVSRAARVEEPKPLGALTRRGWNDLSTDAEFGAAMKAYKDRDFEEGERRAKTVVARFPDSAPAHLFLGQVYLQRRSYVEAANSFERAIQLKRDLAPAWAGLAVADAQQGLRDRARDAAREVKKLDPALAKELIDSTPALAP